MKRRLTRRGTRRTMAPSMYNEDEEEEGYGSGEYDDGPFELVKIRVKVGFAQVLHKRMLTCFHIAALQRRCARYGAHTRNTL